MFQCPKCGSPGEIYLIKVSGPQMIVKQRCPTHGGRSFKIPLRDLDNYINSIRDGVFRCYKCGRRANPGPVKFSGPYAIFNCVCQVPGHSKKTQKIWSTIYMNITSSSLRKPKPLEKPKQNQVKEKTPQKNKTIEQFCPNCGTKLEGNEKFCGVCGVKLNK